MSTHKLQKELVEHIDAYGKAEHEYGINKGDYELATLRRKYSALLELLDKTLYDIFFEGYDDGRNIENER
jgi:hypothetical protein